MGLYVQPVLHAIGRGPRGRKGPVVRANAGRLAPDRRWLSSRKRRRPSDLAKPIWLRNVGSLLHPLGKYNFSPFSR